MHRSTKPSSLTRGGACAHVRQPQRAHHAHGRHPVTCLSLLCGRGKGSERMSRVDRSIVDRLNSAPQCCGGRSKDRGGHRPSADRPAPGAPRSIDSGLERPRRGPIDGRAPSRWRRGRAPESKGRHANSVGFVASVVFLARSAIEGRGAEKRDRQGAWCAAWRGCHITWLGRRLLLPVMPGLLVETRRVLIGAACVRGAVGAV